MIQARGCQTIIQKPGPACCVYMASKLGMVFIFLNARLWRVEGTQRTVFHDTRKLCEIHISVAHITFTYLCIIYNGRIALQLQQKQYSLQSLKYRVGKSRSTVLSTKNTQVDSCIILNCIIFHMNTCKPTFAYSRISYLKYLQKKLTDP